VTVALAVGGVILLAMICVSWYGWVTLPGDARVPIHFGGSYNNFVSKRAGLVMHPAAGAVTFLIFAFVGHGNSANGASSKAHPYVILPVIMCVLLVTQAGAIRVARRRSGV
jgi:4-amino-4-deoxy-L-arabinose transferase-like glycosyltransferase